MERRCRAGRGCDVGRGATRRQGAVDRGAAQRRGARRGEAEIGRGRAGYAPPRSAGAESASRLPRLRKDVQCAPRLPSSRLHRRRRRCRRVEEPPASEARAGDVRIYSMHTQRVMPKRCGDSALASIPDAVCGLVLRYHHYHKCWTMSYYAKIVCATNITYEIYVECACIRKQKEEEIEIFIGTPCQVSAYFLLLCQGQAFRKFVGGYTRWCPLLKRYIACNHNS